MKHREHSVAKKHIMPVCWDDKIRCHTVRVLDDMPRSSVLQKTCRREDKRIAKL